MTEYLQQTIETNIESELPKLLALHGVTGHEEDVEAYVKDVVGPLVDSITTDPLGNVIAYKEGNGKKKLLVAAHMDEIGLMIKYIDKNGFIYVETVGGVRQQNLYARECEIKTDYGKVPGIINSIRPGRPYGDEQIPDSNDFFIDVGADNIQDIHDMHIEVGQPVKFKYQYQRLNDKVSGTALDNRLLMFILIEVLKILENDGKKDIPDVYAVFTTQEEVGSRGAQTATQQIEPDVALALDITMANDLPKNHESEFISKIGKGPAIKAMDIIKRAMLGLVVPKYMINQLKDVAKDHHIPFQIEVQSAGSTDGATIHKVGNGIPTGGICLPTRYVHAYELAAIPDIVHTTMLLYESIKAFK
ncbi:MAG TPA: hypothetical protein VK111_00240 [Virgibacillus sp.]|nr:hypothetical protein [Virgibacillus sp.]